MTLGAAVSSNNIKEGIHSAFEHETHCVYGS